MIKVRFYHEAMDLLGSGEATAVECHGHVFTRHHYLKSCGYERAKERGILDEYKREILGIE